jgi:hypothetical protein
MRFTKRFAVWCAVALLAGAMFHECAAANRNVKHPLVADGTQPLPTPPLVADGTQPLPTPPLVADGTQPLPTPPLVDGIQSLRSVIAA